MNRPPVPQELAEPVTHGWACAELGVGEDASTDAVRAAFLKQVSDSDFFPSEDSVVAWQILKDPATVSHRVAEAARHHANVALRTRVEQFAAQFFSIEVGERVRQWFDLRSRCQDSAPLRERLEALSSGLNVDPQLMLPEPTGPGAQPSEERMVAERIFEMFVLRPIDRAERQQEIMLSWQAELKAWQVATRQLKKSRPKIAELDPEFVDLVLQSPQLAKQQARQTLDKFRQAQRPLEPFMKVAAPAEVAKSKFGAWGGSLATFLILIFLSGVSRCARENSSNSYSPNYRSPNLNVPAQQPANPFQLPPGAKNVKVGEAFQKLYGLPPVLNPDESENSSEQSPAPEGMPAEEERSPFDPPADESANPGTTDGAFAKNQNIEVAMFLLSSCIQDYA